MVNPCVESQLYRVSQRHFHIQNSNTKCVPEALQLVLWKSINEVSCCNKRIITCMSTCALWLAPIDELNGLDVIDSRVLSSEHGRDNFEGLLSALSDLEDDVTVQSSHGGILHDFTCQADID